MAEGQNQGFRNIEPRAREDRLAARGGDKLEKQRLQQRGLDPPANPVVPVKNSPQYVDEYQRFQRDTAAEEQQRRQAKLNRKEEIYEGKRVEGYYREKVRWDHMESAAQKHEQGLQQKRDTGAGAKRNQSGEHYNILTLEHKSTPEGERLRQKDEGVLQKANLRAQNLYAKSNSVSHNIITGQPLHYPQPAAAAAQRSSGPVAPWDK